MVPVEGTPTVNVCISTAKTLYYPQGGHLWVFINWALGFRALGHSVRWLDLYDPAHPADEHERYLATLRGRLRPYGLADTVVLAPADGRREVQKLSSLPPDSLDGFDLCFNLRYNLPAALLQKFRRTALLDIDPGLSQQAIDAGGYACPRHDVYFTIGEGVVSGACRVPTLGVEWHYLPPAVFLGEWPVSPVPAEAAFSTVSHWESDEWQVDPDGSVYPNHKKAAFAPFLDLPSRFDRAFELSLHLPGDATEAKMLRGHGWRVREAHDVVGSPADFRDYVRASAAEFSCAKPWYTRRQTGWISDRTPCYLATGRPAVLENTGRCRVLDDVDDGLLRFTTFDEAVRQVRRVEADYARHSRAARRLAEDHFDATTLAARVLERVM